ncbi:MAG: efflux RND transporter periplasmic adaptor subunit [bacterium]|nr:efflux RND transporter periplasmic adaptor subunit [bacterium]
MSLHYKLLSGWRILLAILISTSSTICLTSCGEKTPPAEPTIRPVRFERVFPTGGTRVRTFSGAAQAGLESQLSFKVAGTVERVAVKVGDRVARRDVIAVLDDSDYRLRVNEAEAALAQTQAQQRNAESSYQRVQALWENASASKQDLESAQAAYESAVAQVHSIEKRLELARLQVGYTTLTAPFTGAVAEVFADENENIRAGSPVIILTGDSQREVKVAVPELLITQIRTGSPATVTFGALPGRELPSVVTEVGVTSTGFATTFPVTVRLNDVLAEIRPGMAAEVAFRFETASPTEALIVPPIAVGEDHHGRFVFIIELAEEGYGIARRRKVHIGELTSEGLEIINGLQEGDLVITAGVSRIIDGQKVKLL